MTLRHLLVVAAAGILLAGCGVTAPDAPAGAVAGADAGAQFAPVSAPAVIPAGVPKLISIPRLGITDDIVPVGLAKDGSMEIPDVHESGWWRLGPTPGSPGPSVISGHVNYDSVPGALGRIGELRRGDLIVVTDVAGIEHTFVVDTVTEIPKVDYKTRTVPLVFGATPGPELRVVTCSGPVVQHNYLNNTIAAAHLVT